MHAHVQLSADSAIDELFKYSAVLLRGHIRYRRHSSRVPSILRSTCVVFTLHTLRFIQARAVCVKHFELAEV